MHSSLYLKEELYLYCDMFPIPHIALWMTYKKEYTLVYSIFNDL